MTDLSDPRAIDAIQQFSRCLQWVKAGEPSLVLLQDKAALKALNAALIAALGLDEKTAKEWTKAQPPSGDVMFYGVRFSCPENNPFSQEQKA